MPGEVLRHHTPLGTVTHCGETEIFVNADLIKSINGNFAEAGFEILLSRLNGCNHQLTFVMSSLTEKERIRIIRPLADRYVEFCAKKHITPRMSFFG